MLVWYMIRSYEVRGANIPGAATWSHYTISTAPVTEKCKWRSHDTKQYCTEMLPPAKCHDASPQSTILVSSNGVSPKHLSPKWSAAQKSAHFYSDKPGW